MAGSGAPVRLFAIVPAAGEGARFGGDTPKQYARLAGRPVLAHTLERLAGALRLETIVVALAPDDTHYEHALGTRTGVEVMHCGGATRAETVRNALAALAPRCAANDFALVHDAARPCVPAEALLRLFRELADDPVGGLLAIPVADTLKRAERTEHGAPPRVARTEDRAGLWQAQTPQMFRVGLLRAALAGDGPLAFTDEAQAMERAGHAPRLVRGSAANLKITYPEDLALAAAILGSQQGAAR
jgi:2-C-methyl-D-erythritol 4-phosphate cytidylyltransferase